MPSSGSLTTVTHHDNGKEELVLELVSLGQLVQLVEGVERVQPGLAVQLPVPEERRVYVLIVCKCAKTLCKFQNPRDGYLLSFEFCQHVNKFLP